MMKQLLAFFSFVFVIASLFAQEARVEYVSGLESKDDISLQNRIRQVSLDPATRESSCGPDTILYVNFKRNMGSRLAIVDIQNGPTSLSTLGQWYPAPSPMEINGVSLFGFVNTVTDVSYDVNISIFNANADSLPVSLIYTEDFTVDTAVATRFFDFTQPAQVNGPYIVAITNLEDSAFAVVVTDPTTNDGGGEDLALGGFPQGNGFAFAKAREFFVGGFDADFLIRPIVSYDFDVDFSVTDDCLVNGAPTTFKNNSSGVLFSRFYNFDNFLESVNFAVDSTFLFEFGDGSDFLVTNDTSFTHTFTVADSNSFTVFGSALYFGMSNVLCFDFEEDTLEVEATSDFTLRQFGDSVLVVSNTLDSVVYDYGDGMGTTSNTTYVYDQVGTYEVSQIAFGCGGTDTTTETVTISVASLNTLPAKSVRIFPNPSQGMITVELVESFNQNLEVRISNLVGQEIARTSGVGHITIDLSNQAPGVYFLQGQVGDQVFTQQIQVE